MFCWTQNKYKNTALRGVLLCNRISRKFHPPLPHFFNYHFQKKSGYKVYRNGSYVHESDANYEWDPTERITVENKLGTISIEGLFELQPITY
jgi:hypothetical protein